MTLEAEGRYYALTCAHVVVNVARKWEGPVGWRTGRGMVHAGVVRKWTGFDASEIYADAALVELVSSLAVEPWYLDGAALPINAIGRFKQNDAGTYFYVSPEGPIHCNSPSWMSIGVFNPDGGRRRARDFWSLRVTSGRARPGHSGALVVKAGIGGYTAMGFLFAGSEAAASPTVWVFPFETIWNSLKLGPMPV